MKDTEITNCINVTRNAGFAADSSMATDQLAALQQRITKLEEALRPFTVFAEWFDGSGADMPEDTLTILDTPDGHIFTVGELRAARALLAEKE